MNKKGKKIFDEFTDQSISSHVKWRRRHPIEASNSDKYRHRRYRKNNPIGYLLKKTRWSAKQRGHEFRITEEDLKPIPKVCPVLGIKFKIGTKKNYDKVMTIDRLDNTKGYIPGNVRIISWRANNVKGDSTVDELERVLKYIRKNIQRRNKK